VAGEGSVEEKIKKVSPKRVYFGGKGGESGAAGQTHDYLRSNQGRGGQQEREGGYSNTRV